MLTPIDARIFQWHMEHTAIIVPWWNCSVLGRVCDPLPGHNMMLYSWHRPGRLLETVSCCAEAKLKHAAEKQQQLVEELQDAQGKLREAQMKRQQPLMQQAMAEHISYHHRHEVAPS